MPLRPLPSPSQQRPLWPGGQPAPLLYQLHTLPLLLLLRLREEEEEEGAPRPH